MHKLRVALRTMFKAVFDRFGEADAPDIDRVTLRLPDRHTPRHARNLDCYLQIDFVGDHHIRRHLDENQTRMQGIPRPQALHAEAQRIYSEMREDRIMHSTTQALSEALTTREGRREYAELVDAFAVARGHAYRVHGVDLASGPDYSAMTQTTPDPDHQFQISERDLTATEIQLRTMRIRNEVHARVREHMDRLLRDLTLGNFQPTYIGADLFGDVGSPEAQAKGLELLKANLTPAQRAMYEEKRYFEVKGGTTGKTYRIHHGRQMNIHEMDDEGKAVCGICFLPQGGLVAGDCMLAQKTALELFEDDALKVANLFPVHTSFVPEEGPRGRPGYGRSALEAFGIRWRVDENLPAGTIRVVPGA